MTQNHDTDARLAMLKDTIDRNRDRLSNHEIDNETQAKDVKTTSKK